MKTRMYGLFLPVTLFALAVLGCSSAAKMRYLNEPYAASEIKIPLAVSEIEFIDNRADTSSRPVNIPRYTKLGQKDTVRQALLAEHRALLTDQIKKCFNGEGSEVKAQVEIIRGNKCFEAGRITEIEYVNVRISLTLQDGEHTPYFLKSSGEAMYEIKSLDAGDEFLEKLYQKGLKAALHKCFEGISSTLQQM
jgi:hypothetical protein